jgi:aryl-alcohol dehydrogenase-like predicted oxidoreductase
MSSSDLPRSRWRAASTRRAESGSPSSSTFSALARNLELVGGIETLAAEKGCTASQLALAWVLRRGEDVVPSFGTKRRKYLLDSLKALEIRLSPEDLRRIEELAPKGAVAGDRYPAAMMGYIGR